MDARQIQGQVKLWLMIRAVPLRRHQVEGRAGAEKLGTLGVPKTRCGSGRKKATFTLLTVCGMKDSWGGTGL